MNVDSSFLFDFARTIYSDLSYSNKDGKILHPLRYILEITYRCNLSCPFCYLGKERKLNELTAEEWINIIKQIPRYAFISFLGGEIFIREDMFKIMKYASDRVFGKINLYTNGTLLNDEKLEELLKLKLLLFSVSIDAIGEKHDALRCRTGVYEKTLKSILYIKQNSKKKLPLTEIKTVILNENIEELPKLYKLCDDNKIDFITFSFLRGTNIRQNPNLLNEFPDEFLTVDYPIKQYFDFSRFEEAYKEIESLSKNAHTLVRWAPKFKPQNSLESIKHLFDSKNNKICDVYKPCKFPFSDIFINPEGEIYPCLPIKMGNLRNEKLVNIINCEKFKKYRKLLKEKKIFTPCHLCCDLYPKK